jgi:hypothetical protein
MVGSNGGEHTSNPVLTQKMLERIVLWVDIVATAADALLLARVLQLRLQRVYLFIALACLVGLFFDIVQLWWGLNSIESQQIGLYSHFLYAFLYPLVAWDVLEEMKDQISRMRRIAMGRLISGLFLSTLCGFILSLFVTGDEGQPVVGITLAVVLWAGSSAATLGFLWSLQRAFKTQKIARPNNTFVWMTFYQLVLLAELVACFGSMLGSFLNTIAQGVITICLLVYSLLITVWCVVRLKRVPSDVPTTTANADA